MHAKRPSLISQYTAFMSSSSCLSSVMFISVASSLLSLWLSKIWILKFIRCLTNLIHGRWSETWSSQMWSMGSFRISDRLFCRLQNPLASYIQGTGKGSAFLLIKPALFFFSFFSRDFLLRHGGCLSQPFSENIFSIYGFAFVFLWQLLTWGQTWDPDVGMHTVSYSLEDPTWKKSGLLIRIEFGLHFEFRT